MKNTPTRKLLTILTAVILLGAGYWLGATREGKKLDPARPAHAGLRPDSRRDSVVVEVAKKLSPAIVTINTTMLVRDRPRINFFGSDIQLGQGRVKEGLFPYMGSGFLISGRSLLGDSESAKSSKADKIYVITNYHVVQNSERIFVTLTDGREFEARMLDADAVVDVALLELKAEKVGNIETAMLGDSDEIMVGETVVALGNPFGPIIEDPSPSVSVGVISAVNRSFQPEVDPQSGNARVYQNMIQTDAAINPGNSGGPLVNMDGEVIGINTFIISPGGSQGHASSAGVNFSTPINRALRVAQEILKYGKVRSLYVDFNVWAVNRQLVARYDLKEDHGMLVYNMARKGPAQAAGLELGDVILRINGREVRTEDEFYATIYSRTVGERLKFQISRDGKIAELEYEIQEGVAQ